MPPTEEGLSHVGGDSPESTRAPYSSEGGSGPRIEEGGSRTSPLRGSGGKS